MSEPQKITTTLIANIGMIIAIIFWCGFTFYNIKDNTKEIERNSDEIKETANELYISKEKHNEDMLYIKTNMITKEDFKELVRYLKKENEQ